MESRELVKQPRYPLFQHANLILDALLLSACQKALNRFVYRLVGKAKRAVVHRNHPARTQIDKGLQGVFWARVNLTERSWVIGADGKQRQVGIQSVSNFSEAIEICGIAGMVYRVSSCAQHVSPVTTMYVTHHARSPVA